MKKLISVKLDPELIKYLDNRSKRENRARNNLIETMLLEGQKADTMSAQNGKVKP